MDRHLALAALRNALRYYTFCIQPAVSSNDNGWHISAGLKALHVERYVNLHIPLKIIYLHQTTHTTRQIIYPAKAILTVGDPSAGGGISTMLAREFIQAISRPDG
jgi:hypothetical protein